VRGALVAGATPWHPAFRDPSTTHLGKKNDLRYAASDCFDTFPFPQPAPRAVIAPLEAIGERLYTARAA